MLGAFHSHFALLELISSFPFLWAHWDCPVPRPPTRPPDRTLTLKKERSRKKLTFGGVTGIRSAPSCCTSPSPCSTAFTPSAAAASRSGSVGKQSAPRTRPRRRPRMPPFSPVRRVAMPCATLSTMPASPPCSTCSSPCTRSEPGPKPTGQMPTPSTKRARRCCPS